MSNFIIRGMIRTRLLARIFAFASICLFAGTAANAEYAVMRSGARFHITGYEVSGAMVRLHLAGGAVDVAAEDILRFEPEEVFVAEPSAKPVIALNGPYSESDSRVGRKIWTRSLAAGECDGCGIELQSPRRFQKKCAGIDAIDAANFFAIDG